MYSFFKAIHYLSKDVTMILKMILNIREAIGLKKILILGLLLLTVGVKAQRVDPPYKMQLAKVEEKLKVGDFREAMGEMDRITAQYPDAAEVYYAKALLFGQTGNYEEALENAKIAYRYEANLVHANFLVELYRSKQNWSEAIPVLEEIRKKYGNISSISRDLMMVLSNDKKLDEAVEVYKEEVAKGNGSDTLDVVLADVYVMHDQLKEAEDLLAPWDGKSEIRHVYGTLGYVYLQQDRIKQAIGVLERGVKYSKDPVLYLDLADAYKADGKNKMTFESLKLAFESNKVEFGDKHRVMISLMRPGFKDFSLDQVQMLANTLVLIHPRIAESHVLKGELLWRRGNTAEARSLFLTAVGINPRHADAWRMLINTDLALNDVDEAIRHADEAIRANPGNAMLMYFSGLAFMVKEDFEKTRVMLEMALDHSEEENTYLRSIIYSSLGDLYHQLKMDAASDVAYEEAIQLDSTNSTALNNLAYYLSIRKKDLEKAATYAKRANEIDTNSPTFQDTYAWVLFQQGNYKEAGVWMEKAIKSSSSPSALLFEHYGDILIKQGREKEAIKYWEKALSMAKSENVDLDKIKVKIKEKRYVE